MAVDIWPYSKRLDGEVSDLEHEALWAGHYDGVFPGQASTALAVAVDTATRGWTVQPGDFLIRGHVLRLDSVESGTLASNPGAARIDVIVAYIDRTTDPWTKGIAVRQGVAGGGRPALKREVTGRWEVALGDAQVLSSGAASLLVAHRPSARPGAQSFGPGQPLAQSGAAPEEIVNTLEIPAAGWDRRIKVSGGCRLVASQPADTLQLRIYRDGVAMVGGGHWQGSGQQAVDTPHLNCTAFVLAAGSKLTLTLRASRYFGTGTWTTLGSPNLNHLDAEADPT